MTFPTSASLFKALVHEIKETAKAFGYGGLTREQKSNLSYAFAQIQPMSVDELAMIIALGLQQKSTHETVDRYIAIRTSGTTFFSPYDKIKGMNAELSKTWGLLLYREQVQNLLEELTGCAFGKLPAVILLDRAELVKRLKATYKSRLSEKDIDTLHNDLLFYTKVGMASQKWCRSVANRVVENS